MGSPVGILAVDDDEKNLRALAALLSGLPARLVLARSGEEALRHLLHEDFAVILLDVQMPGLGGLETAAIIRERERSRRTPIIFLTAFDRSDDQLARGYALGAVDFLSKPSENAEGNLSAEQVEFARTIHASGADLMALINDILDLSKIESGTIQVEVGLTPVADLVADLRRSFAEVAREKGLSFTVDVDPSTPAGLVTDGRRLQQIVKNLLSNAFKFTERGGVSLSIRRATGGWGYESEALAAADSVVAFDVKDTGIGIAPDKQRIIFEAFQQADGSTARRYGGTGLGLSISRELARLLGGEIQVRSATGEGSTFTLYVPRAGAPRATARAPKAARAAEGDGAEPRPAHGEPPRVADDRAALRPGDRALLVVEEDPVYAALVAGVARELGWKALVARRGDEALALARDAQPDAITLELVLPDLEGHALLDLLKRDPRTRQIPVHVITGRRDERGLALRLGAVASLVKPATREELAEAVSLLAAIASRRTRRLLVAGGDEAERTATAELLGGPDVEILARPTLAAALEAATPGHVDCAVVLRPLADGPVARLVAGLQGPARRVPVVVHGPPVAAEADELAGAVAAGLLRHATSPEQLLDATAVLLHRRERELPPDRREMIRRAHRPDPALAGKTALVVDDDVRNAFALTAVLERHGLQVLYAESGQAALELARRQPDVVLMDVMMPGMDGLEATRALRAMPEGARVPIVALTAKAMKGDRNRCLEAGASDYVAKPVDPEQLLSLLRVWLYDARAPLRAGEAPSAEA